MIWYEVINTKMKRHWITIMKLLCNSRPPKDMDGWLTLIFGKSETSRDITTKTLPFVHRFKIELGMTGLFFEPPPSNFVRSHILKRCTNGKILVMISPLVSDLPKISVSQPSISWGVLALTLIRPSFLVH